jgi:hypothetical protein
VAIRVSTRKLDLLQCCYGQTHAKSLSSSKSKNLKPQHKTRSRCWGQSTPHGTRHVTLASVRSFSAVMLLLFLVVTCATNKIATPALSHLFPAGTSDLRSDWRIRTFLPLQQAGTNKLVHFPALHADPPHHHLRGWLRRCERDISPVVLMQTTCTQIQARDI